jgi:hypothetical protein
VRDAIERGGSMSLAMFSTYSAYGALDYEAPGRGGLPCMRVSRTCRSYHLGCLLELASFAVERKLKPLPQR